MRAILLPAVVAFGMAAMVAIVPANAAGCIKGAIVGGVVGHMAGHHGAVGAAAGCAVGHHEASKSAKASTRNAGGANQTSNNEH